jgi:putative endonuclease
MFKKKGFLSFGARGEKAAAIYLKKCGYDILAMNFANTKGRRLGEIDIIAKDKNCLVFVEVKARTLSSKDRPLPEESITPTKLYKINKAASLYISQNRLFDLDYRFDAVTLLVDSSEKTASLKHMKNIFF